MIETEIIKELKAIKEDLRYIKEHMVDIDTILTSDEEKALKESIDEFERGKTIRLKDLERCSD
jgi:hypothetical protein